ncbi:MAG: winged helix-turn-helix domain-containing protein [Chloroflexota bacterium]|nr:winged helix-turn-helix domain-containing protein [Chloroflexota bacterium]
MAAWRAFVDNRDIHLTHKELSLLTELAAHIDALCTHQELLARVWGGEYWDANHYLHIYFGRIRKKMGAAYSELIETIPGIGYMLHSRRPQAQLKT